MTREEEVRLGEISAEHCPKGMRHSLEQLAMPYREQFGLEEDIVYNIWRCKHCGQQWQSQFVFHNLVRMS
jgi:hypothetical protein